MNIDLLQKGDCILVSNLNPDIVADGIEWFSGGSVSHVAVYVGDGLIVEALRTGVKKNSISKYESGFKVYGRRLIFGGQGEKIGDYVLKRVGNRYDFSQVVIDGVFLLAGKMRLVKFQNWLAVKIHGWRDGYTCSELYSEAAWEMAGINVFPSKDIRLHSPQDLLSSGLLKTILIV